MLSAGVDSAASAGRRPPATSKTMTIAATTKRKAEKIGRPGIIESEATDRDGAQIPDPKSAIRNSLRLSGLSTKRRDACPSITCRRGRALAHRMRCSRFGAHRPGSILGVRELLSSTKCMSSTPLAHCKDSARKKGDNKTRVLSAEYSVLDLFTEYTDSAVSKRAMESNLLSAYCALPTSQCCLPTAAYCSLLTAYCSLFTVHCSLFTVHCSLLTAHCSLLTALSSSSKTVSRCQAPLLRSILQSHDADRKAHFATWPSRDKQASRPCQPDRE
jgi:hypothetical protein